MNNESKVRVAVRVAPSTADSLLRGAGSRRCLYANHDKKSVNIGDKNFNFDYVFDENSSQLDVYNSCVSSLVTGCFKGFNGTVFACKSNILKLYIYIFFYVDIYETSFLLLLF